MFLTSFFHSIRIPKNSLNSLILEFERILQSPASLFNSSADAYFWPLSQQFNSQLSKTYCATQQLTFCPTLKQLVQYFPWRAQKSNFRHFNKMFEQEEHRLQAFLFLFFLPFLLSFFSRFIVGLSIAFVHVGKVFA